MIVGQRPGLFNNPAAVAFVYDIGVYTYDLWELVGVNFTDGLHELFCAVLGRLADQERFPFVLNLATRVVE